MPSGWQRRLKSGVTTYGPEEQLKEIWNESPQARIIGVLAPKGRDLQARLAA